MPNPPNWSTQIPYGIRFDWGPTGAQALAPNSASLVVVDVLSFTTATTVAVEAGTRVFPYPWRDDTAVAFATRKHASLAVARSAVTPASPWSLSPAGLRRAPFTDRLVLPSPNGSTIAAAANGRLPVVAGCLRNASATARWLIRHGLGTPAHPVSVIAAGEHWPDGSLRPALEDLLGAAAIIAALVDGGLDALSPEAVAAGACPRERMTSMIEDCASGRELNTSGFAEDVAIATQIDSTDAVPVFTDDTFASAG